jgi:Tfp pilus assembly protein PilX
MRSSRHLPPTDRESGSVLVLAMLVALVILGVGLSALFLSNSGMRISGNLSRRQEALGAAETGTERALAILRTNATNDWDSLLVGGCTATPFDPTKGNILCDGATPLENVPVVATVPDGLPATYGQYLAYTVYIRNDPTEASGLGAFNDEDKRVVVRSEGVGRDGVSFFAIETIIAVTMPVDGTGMTQQHLGGPRGSSSYMQTGIKLPTVGP